MSGVRRSCLVVPGSSAKMLEKARSLDADEIVIDLEDAVPLSEKNDVTRRRVAEALQDRGWLAGLRAVRVNAVSSPWFEDDVRRLSELAGDAIDAIVVPKVECIDDVRAIVALLESVGMAAAIEVQIESARGLLEVERIAGASTRLAALIFGPGDYAASVGVAQTIGAIEARYPGDQWHYAKSRIAAAAHAFGLEPIDGPFADFKDVNGLLESARRARLLGFRGKWVIHPSQIALVRTEFVPSDEEIARARRILEALDKASLRREGAVQVDGAMVDEASRRAAQATLARA